MIDYIPWMWGSSMIEHTQAPGIELHPTLEEPDHPLLEVGRRAVRGSPRSSIPIPGMIAPIWRNFTR